MLPTFLYSVLALAWGVFAWHDPRKAILWFPVLLPTYVLRTNMGPLPTTLLELCWLTLVIAITSKQGFRIWKDELTRIKPWHRPIIAWVIVTFLAIFVAPDHLAALGLWRAYILEPILFFILLSAYLETEQDRWTVIKSLILTTCGIAIWSLIQFVTGLGIPHPWDTASLLTRRATGPFPFPNAVALFCAPIAALCISLLSPPYEGGARGGSARRTLWVGFISATLATLLAKSVGGSLGIAAAIFCVLVWNKKTRLGTFVMIAVLGMIIWFIPPIHHKVARTLTFNEWSGKVRIIIWKETGNMLRDRPILGAGLGAYPDVIKPYHKATFIEIFQYPHNILLNLWSETGLLGILVFGWICVTWIRLSQRSSSDQSYRLQPTACSLALIAILIQGLVDVPYFKNDLAFAFWILAALASMTETRFNKSDATNDPSR